MIVALVVIVIVALLLARRPAHLVVENRVWIRPALTVRRLEPAKVWFAVRPTMRYRDHAREWLCPCGAADSDIAIAAGKRHACALERWEQR